MWQCQEKPLQDEIFISNRQLWPEKLRRELRTCQGGGCLGIRLDMMEKELRIRGGPGPEA